MQPKFTIDFLADDFFFFPMDSHWQSWGIAAPVRVVEIPRQVNDPQEMIRLIVDSILGKSTSVQLDANLNAFHDLLAWPEATCPKTLLLHHGIPDLESPLTVHYLEIIYGYLGDWMGDGQCLWAVGFPEYARETIRGILRG